MDNKIKTGDISVYIICMLGVILSVLPVIIMFLTIIYILNFPVKTNLISIDAGKTIARNSASKDCSKRGLKDCSSMDVASSSSHDYGNDGIYYYYVVGNNTNVYDITLTGSGRVDSIVLYN